MRTLTLAYGAVVVLFLGGGYLGAVWPWLTMADPAERSEAVYRWHMAVNTPTIHIFCWVLFLSGLALSYALRNEDPAP